MRAWWEAAVEGGLGAAALGAALSLAGADCDAGGDLLLCGEIPSGGCPIGRGGSCDDVLCAGLYDCVEGRWTLVKSCPPAPDGGGGGAGGGAGAAGGDAGPGGADAGCHAVPVDHTGETSGCTPDLQLPDCPVAAVEACAETACATECTDFYLCQKAGWLLVAFCDANGQLVVGSAP